jgi:hypothetical protein
VRFGLTGDVPPRPRSGHLSGSTRGGRDTADLAIGHPPDVHECGSCGAAVMVADAAFCCRCGEPLRGWCPACHAAVRGGRFCIECGEALET